MGATDVFENIVYHADGEFTSSQSSKLHDLKYHGCWCRGFDLFRRTGGSPVSELDHTCREYSQCMTCSSECGDTELDIILERDQNGDLVCDSELSDCMYQKCLCMHEFSNSVKAMDWESILSEDDGLFVGDTCDATQNGGETNGGDSNGADGGSNSATDDMCARRRRKRALFS